jgi:hypothetical protein
VTKLNTGGTALVYSTLLGGTAGDLANGIAVDPNGYAYVTGQTYSLTSGTSGFPITPGAFQTAGAGVSDAFITKLGTAGNALAYSTFLGGSAGDFGNGIAVDSSGYAYVTGWTASANFPTTSFAYDALYGGGTYGDAFVSKLGTAGDTLTYSTFLGGAAADYGNAIVADTNGNAYVAGYTQSSDFPTTAAGWDRYFAGSGDGFVTMVDPLPGVVTNAAADGGGSSYGDGEVPAPGIILPWGIQVGDLGLSDALRALLLRVQSGSLPPGHGLPSDGGWPRGGPGGPMTIPADLGLQRGVEIRAEGWVRNVVVRNSGAGGAPIVGPLGANVAKVFGAHFALQVVSDLGVFGVAAGDVSDPPTHTGKGHMATGSPSSGKWREAPWRQGRSIVSGLPDMGSLMSLAARAMALEDLSVQVVGSIGALWAKEMARPERMASDGRQVTGGLLELADNVVLSSGIAAAVSAVMFGHVLSALDISAESFRNEERSRTRRVQRENRQEGVSG